MSFAEFVQMLQLVAWSAVAFCIIVGIVIGIAIAERKEKENNHGRR